MSDVSQIEIKGVEELLRQFETIKDIDIPEGCLAGSEALRRYSMAQAPVLTGFLRSSHTSEKTEDGAIMEVQAEYAFYVEFGHHSWAGHPFIRPAIDENTDKILRAIRNNLRKQIKALAGAGGDSGSSDTSG